MDKGTLYAGKEKKSAYAEVLNSASKGDDVALIKLGGTIKLQPGHVVIIQVREPLMKADQGHVTWERFKEIYAQGFDRIGIMGTVSRAVTNKIGIQTDFEFATPYATVAAAKRGLNVLVFAVGKMSKSLTKKLEHEGLRYKIENVSLEEFEK